jgi:hypothetical protein
VSKTEALASEAGESQHGVAPGITTFKTEVVRIAAKGFSRWFRRIKILW